ncbi:OPT super [Conoideocrella luteorostrata]|uniref:OPT super n=1 Tax=Conoideocrella luteorostrata TaxID=1105319 RepID=A0AAJ0FXW6_9HYPO|nr:OPT super [Conoideocrella luteorostrata]
MLARAIVGWALLSSLAKDMSWAPGPVRDWESGSRGWIIWISLVAMLVDALVDLVWFVAQPVLLSLKFREEPCIDRPSLIVGCLIPQSSLKAKLINLVAGGVAEAGAVQSGFMMKNLRTGYLSGSSPDTPFFSQALGSLFGAIISSMLYRLYTSVYSVPGEIFQVPSAYVWRAGAALAVGEGLPPRALDFALVAATMFASFTVARFACGNSNHRHFIPMGIPFSVGMYDVPSFTWLGHWESWHSGIGLVE